MTPATASLHNLEMDKRKNRDKDSNPSNILDFGAAQRELETTMGELGKALETMDFESLQDLKQFLNKQLTGKTLPEISEEFAGLGKASETTALEAANEIIYSIPPDASPTASRVAARKALKLSPDCIGAYLVLGDAEKSRGKAIKHYEAAAACGRRIHAHLISQLEEGGPGLWIFHEARDFMIALECIAESYDEIDDFDRRLALHEEMIRLNPNDNQGVRGALLWAYLSSARLDDAKQLLARFSKDTITAIVYGRALVALIDALEKTRFSASRTRPQHPGPIPGSEIHPSRGI